MSTRPLVQGEVLRLVIEERSRQELLVESGRFPWTCAAPDAPDAYKLAVLTEEFGEVAKAMLVASGDQGADGNLRTELIQVAAVAVAWAEALT